VRARVLVALWVVIGAAVWNGFFDLYVSRGATHYLQLQAEFELGRRPEPSMSAVMNDAKRNGLIAASIWATLITGGGWVTTAVLSRRLLK
jgi:hypothetical protein